MIKMPFFISFIIFKIFFATRQHKFTFCQIFPIRILDIRQSSVKSFQYDLLRNVNKKSLGSSPRQRQNSSFGIKIIENANN